MPTHDIIDNRQESLLQHIARIMPSSERAKFAVGYFFLSGFAGIEPYMKGLKELRLLVGNTTNRETVEQLVEGYQTLDLVENALEEMKYAKRSEVRRMVQETAGHVQRGLGLMEQSDENQLLVTTLAQMIGEGRVKVRVYNKERLHAKAYIFDYGPVYDEVGNPLPRQEKGIAIVGSSNLSIAALSHNTELNVIVHGNDNHAALTAWFDDLWDNAEDFNEAFMHELRESWAMAPVTPYDVYMKSLYELVKDRLEGEGDTTPLWDDDITRDLADFQKVAVRQAIRMIKDHKGCFISDVVGLGKSFIGAAILKHFGRVEGARPLVICPAPLAEMWERYSDTYGLAARILSMGLLRDDRADMLLKDDLYASRDFVLVDESHNLRHPDTQRYRVLQEYLIAGDRKCCFLTATPYNKSAWDIYHQMKLFHPEDKTEIPVNPPNLFTYFKEVEAGKKDVRDLLSYVLIRRTRRHILKWYGFDAKTDLPIDPNKVKDYLDGIRKAYIIVGNKRLSFPGRRLETVSYSIESTYQGLYDKIRRYLGKPRKSEQAVPPGELTYARYGLWHYVLPGKRKEKPYSDLETAGANLRGLARVLLFKRFESSVHALKETVRRMKVAHLIYLEALDKGFVPAGKKAQELMYGVERPDQDFMEELSQLSGSYLAKDFDVPLLRAHIAQDLKILTEILALVEPITPDRDAKLQALKDMLQRSPFARGKVLVFTQYADTAQYLYNSLKDTRRNDIGVVHSDIHDKVGIVARFAPKANSQYATKGPELNLLVTTDVLAEGLNLQDANAIINYDLHWNPTRLIQRFGRIDRIGSENEIVYGYNFLLEKALEKNLRLEERLKQRIQEIHTIIGEDAAILSPDEALNEEAMYAIYEGRIGDLEEMTENGDLVSLSEAEEMFRLMQSQDPREFERVKSLRDGIRTARVGEAKGTYVMCAAGNYRKLYLLDESGKEVSTDVPRVLEAIRADADVPASPLPPGHNKTVVEVRRRFAEEVKHHRSHLAHATTPSKDQQYVLRELRLLFERAGDADLQGQINIIEKAVRGPLPVGARKEIASIRRLGLQGGPLLKALADIYHKYNLGALAQQRLHQQAREDLPLPVVVCSERLV